MFPGLHPITLPLRVTRYVFVTIPLGTVLYTIFFDSLPLGQRNLVNELDSLNPTALLVSAIEKSAPSRKVAKDNEFYLGVLRDGDLWQVHRIMSGGPSRGTLALETEAAPGEGTSARVSLPLSAGTS